MGFDHLPHGFWVRSLHGRHPHADPALPFWRAWSRSVAACRTRAVSRRAQSSLGRLAPSTTCSGRTCCDRGTRGLAAIARATADPPGDHRRRAARHQDRLFNVVFHRGRVLGVVLKVHLPNYREFYERRQFASGRGIVGLEIAAGVSARRSAPTCCSTRSTCRASRSGRDLRGHVRAGAAVQRAGPGRCTVLANLSGSLITIGRAAPAPSCRTQSMRCLSAYLYAAAGQGESTTDLSWDGQTSIFENGRQLGQGPASRRSRS